MCNLAGMVQKALNKAGITSNCYLEEEKIMLTLKLSHRKVFFKTVKQLLYYHLRESKSRFLVYMSL